MYRITLSEQARKEYLYFSQSGNKAILNKIAALLNDIAEHPYTGLGKPEPLKYELAGWRKVNCVMRCFSFKLIGRGSASAKGVHQHSRRA